MDDYEKMLERAYSQVPKDTFNRTGERFQVPSVIIMIQGNQSIWQNFQDIINTIHRPGKEVVKFMSKNIGAAINMEGDNAIFNGKFEQEQVEDVLNRYIDVYVICPVCTRPDTDVKKESNTYYLICSACGARTSIKPVK